MKQRDLGGLAPAIWALVIIRQNSEVLNSFTVESHRLRLIGCLDKSPFDDSKLSESKLLTIYIVWNSFNNKSYVLVSYKIHWLV